MAALIIVDSDVLIAHLRDVPAATEWLIEERRRQPLGVSVVSVVEVLGGMRSAERRKTHGLLDTLFVQPVDEDIAMTAGELMRRHRRSHHNIGVGDYLIAATALEAGCEVATLNVKHFPAFPGLQPPFSL